MINMSLGGYGGYQEIIELALNDVDSGKCAPLVVTSAGNDNIDVSLMPHFFSGMSDSLTNVISVSGLRIAAIDGTERDTMLNFGSNITIATEAVSFVPFGETGHGATGTSMAAANISGILAYIFEEEPGISSTLAKNVLMVFTISNGFSLK